MKHGFNLPAKPIRVLSKSPALKTSCPHAHGRPASGDAAASASSWATSRVPETEVFTRSSLAGRQAGTEIGSVYPVAFSPFTVASGCRMAMRSERAPNNPLARATFSSTS